MNQIIIFCGGLLSSLQCTFLCGIFSLSQDESWRFYVWSVSVAMCLSMVSIPRSDICPIYSSCFCWDCPIFKYAHLEDCDHLEEVPDVWYIYILSISSHPNTKMNSNWPIRVICSYSFVWMNAIFMPRLVMLMANLNRIPISYMIQCQMRSFN